MACLSKEEVVLEADVRYASSDIKVPKKKACPEG
jgi:hypothetical protein